MYTVLYIHMYRDKHYIDDAITIIKNPGHIEARDPSSSGSTHCHRDVHLCV